MIVMRLARTEQTAGVRVARDELRRIRDLTRSIDALQRELATLVTGLAPQLLAERGYGLRTKHGVIANSNFSIVTPSSAKYSSTACVSPAHVP